MYTRMYKFNNAQIYFETLSWSAMNGSQLVTPSLQNLC
jgi:hypothetical protein